jgi:excisionase family DNA binding protein
MGKINETDWLTVKDVCEMLSLNKFTVYQMVKDGRLHATRMEGSKKMYFKLSEIEAKLNKA